MCRLFGLHAGTPVDAEFWLLEAPDSLAAQSHRNPDGAGIGAFGPSGRPEVSKQPIAAWQDTDFARAARHLRGTTFVAHVRYASTGAHTMANTHPFLQDGRLFAHNGVVQGLPDLDRRLAELGTADLVHGETDSERVFALITGETRRHGGDLHRGIVEAIGWIAVELPVFALNLVLTTATDLWALRYPGYARALRAGPPGGRQQRQRCPGGTHRPDQRPVTTSGGPALGGHRQREDRRRPRLAAAGRGRAAAHRPQPAASAAAHPSRRCPGTRYGNPTWTRPPRPPSTRPDGATCLPSPGRLRAAVPARWRSGARDVPG